MKSESSERPSEFEICELGDEAEVRLRENITVKPAENGKEAVWVYDEYILRVGSRKTLKESIIVGFDDWLNAAKEAEYQNYMKQVRQKRNRLLCESDWTQVTDSPLTAEIKARWAEYRQTLRDITEGADFPYRVRFPDKPE